MLSLCLFYFFLRKQYDAPLQNDILFILFLFYAAFSLPGLLMSPLSVGNGLFEWMKVLLLPSLILVMTAVFRNHNDFINDLSKSITLLASLLIFYGIYQLTEITTIGHQALYTIKTTFAHKNIFSEVLLLMLPFALYCFFSLKRFWRWTGVFSAFFSIAFIVILMTRAVWIAFFVSTFALVALYLFLSIRRKKNQH